MEIIDRPGTLVGLTESAATKIKKLMQDETEGDATVLRIAVQGGGCSGFEYALGFDSAAQEGDHELESHGVTAVLVQIGAAGYGAFNAAEKVDPGPLREDSFDDGFDFHNGFGYIIFLGSLILLLLALGGRLGKQRVLQALAAPVLVAIQIVLAW